MDDDTDDNGDEEENGEDENGEDENDEDELGSAEDQELDPEEWEDVEEVEVLGHGSGWVGVEPEMIEDIENPTLLLTEGEEYDLTWINDDGANHNIEVWDENGEIVDDYETELMNDVDEAQTLEIEASSEMAEYVCEPHAGPMSAEIQVE